MTAAVELYPSCIVIAVASAPTSAAWLLGIPPNCQNAFVFLLMIIFTSWHASHAVIIVNIRFIFAW